MIILLCKIAPPEIKFVFFLNLRKAVTALVGKTFSRHPLTPQIIYLFLKELCLF